MKLTEQELDGTKNTKLNDEVIKTTDKSKEQNLPGQSDYENPTECNEAILTLDPTGKIESIEACGMNVLGF